MMGRKEEERNEKIIRGLMKLPPNRRCINCSSLGPQYVCTNFWTFVCTTCSGIHREFTHRVKSVSMAKFTTQEVEALQRDGNQRAREIFLKGWDIQNQRLPNSSNVDKIREFIKAVYVEKKYARETSSDKPPRDVQNNRNFEEDRRASSYHSYSQSPPYDHQYEDRRYGKQSGVLTRRTGSDRLHYDGKLAGIAYSPGRMGEHTYEDRFASDGSDPRYSDYSVSSAGETLRFDVQSPNFQKDSGYSSPSQSVRNNLFEEDNAMRDVHKNPQSWTTTSLSSFESGNPLPLRSVKSASLVDVKFVSEQHSVTQLRESSVPPSLPQSTGQTHAVKQDLFSLPSVNSVQPSTSSAPQFIDLFAEINQPPSTTSSDHKREQIPFTKNEGWATFDLLQPAGSSFEPKNASSNIPPMDEISKVNFDSFSSETNSSRWPSAQTFAGHQHVGSVNDQWNLASHEANQSVVLSSSEFWNAFDDSTGNSAQTSTGSSSAETNAQVVADQSHLFVDPYVGFKPPEASSKYDFQQITVDSGFPVHSVSFGDGIIGPTNPLAVFPNMGKNAHERKSVNPFDFPCEPELGPGNALDMSSMHAALPNPQFHAAFSNNISQPFFPQNPLPPYMPTAPSGGLSYMAGQPPNSHLPNLSSQSHVASLGGNPFA